MLINELLNIKYPIICGAMANITTGEFAACVSNAGGLGIIASGGYDHERLKEEIRICKSKTSKPFGVNVMLLNPDVAEIINVICEEQVPVVTTGAGNPGKYMEKLTAAGCKVFPVIARVALAKRLSRYNVAGFIVEGTESGGHVGEATTMALVPQVVAAVDVPVIAAGGIASGAQLNAAFALGAVGVQVGTIMLASKECPIHENYKQAILNAKDSDTVVTGRSQNAPVRVLKNDMSRKYLELESHVASRDELEALTLGSLKKAVFEGDVLNGSLMMGQVAGMIHEIKSVEEILKDLIKGSILEKEELISKINKLEEIR